MDRNFLRTYQWFLSPGRRCVKLCWRGDSWMYSQMLKVIFFSLPLVLYLSKQPLICHSPHHSLPITSQISISRTTRPFLLLIPSFRKSRFHQRRNFSSIDCVILFFSREKEKRAKRDARRMKVDWNQPAALPNILQFFFVCITLSTEFSSSFTTSLPNLHSISLDAGLCSIIPKER